MASETLYFEDLAAGDERQLGSSTLTEADIVAFAERYDPQPMHADVAAAHDAPHGGLIASGWQTAAVCQRHLVEGFLSDVAVVASPGIDDVRWYRPVRPGDTLSVDARVTETDDWDDDRGLVYIEVVATDEAGRTVHDRTDLVLVERRPTA